MDRIKNLKLYIELVPESCWYENLRKVLSKNEWDTLRKEVYHKSGNKCEICGAIGKLNCHEIWEYGDERNIQYLKGFQALCDSCHNIKHIGFVNIQISKGIWSEQVLNDLKKHFMMVNHVSSSVFRQHVKYAFGIWRKRSKEKWKTDLGNYVKNQAQKTLF